MFTGALKTVNQTNAELFSKHFLLTDRFLLEVPYIPGKKYIFWKFL